MALGDQAGLQAVQTLIAEAPGLIAKLQAAGHAEEAALLQGIHDVLSSEVNQIGAILRADLAPLIAESQAWRVLIGKFATGFEIVPKIS